MAQTDNTGKVEERTEVTFDEDEAVTEAQPQNTTEDDAPEAKPKPRQRKRPMTYKLPDHVTEEADGRFRVDFGKKVTIGGTKVDHVMMRGCLVKDKLAAREMLEPDQKEDAEQSLYILLCNLIDQAPDALDDLPFTQFRKLADAHRGVHAGADPRTNWCTGDTEDGFDIELRFGVDRDGAVVKRYHMNPVTVGTRKKAAKVKDPVRNEIRMIALCCGVPDTEVESLNIWDYQRLLECMQDFLQLET